ncbi:MAG: helical backbone metal receptor [Candidatus Eremiobacteraeota bacterium]|nr:helical backbone metal receptor [Candidatus Eremiobacteraeota bacterium]
MRARSFIAFALLLLYACAATAPQREGVPPAHRRFVALVPSLAEDLFAIGAGGRVVGVSQFTGIAPQSVARVADFESVDTEKIVALHPDAVVAIPAQERFIEPLRRAGIRVDIIRDDTFDDIFGAIRRLGRLSGRDDAAREKVAQLRAQTYRLRTRAMSFRRRPRVFFVLGTGPLWTVGSTSYLGQLVKLAGGADAAAIQQPWGQYSEEALVHADPDAIVAGPQVRLRDVLGREPWRSLRAVREGHVFLIGDERVANALYRPGPGYNEGLRWLIERLTPLAR